MFEFAIFEVRISFSLFSTPLENKLFLICTDFVFFYSALILLVFGKFDYSVLILSVRCVCTDFVLFYSALLLLVLGKFDYSVLILSVRCVCTDSTLFNSAIFMLQLVIFVSSLLCSFREYLFD